MLGSSKSKDPEVEMRQQVLADTNDTLRPWVLLFRMPVLWSTGQPSGRSVP